MYILVQYAVISDRWVVLPLTITSYQNCHETIECTKDVCDHLPSDAECEIQIYKAKICYAVRYGRNKNYVSKHMQILIQE